MISSSLPYTTTLKFANNAPIVITLYTFTCNEFLFYSVIFFTYWVKKLYSFLDDLNNSVCINQIFLITYMSCDHNLIVYRLVWE